jgi:16S rRNA (adenine1518-N6/adenine1519-N6)-dimethyltransferase
LQYRYVMEKLIDVPPESFDPPPKVDSAVVRLIPLPKPELAATDEKLFSDLVTRAFMQRRKTVRNVLRDQVTDAEFEAAGIDVTLRPENVTVLEYVRLANQLALRA